MTLLISESSDSLKYQHIQELFIFTCKNKIYITYGLRSFLNSYWTGMEFSFYPHKLESVNILMHFYLYLCHVLYSCFLGTYRMLSLFQYMFFFIYYLVVVKKKVTLFMFFTHKKIAHVSSTSLIWLKNE